MLKKLLSLFCVISLLLINILPVMAVENSKLTYLYLDKGSITIGDGTVKGYGYFGEEITTPDSDGYLITQSTTDAITNTIIFDGGKNYIVLRSLKISLQNQVSTQYACALALKNSAEVTVKLEGTNVLISGDARAGMEVSEGTTLTICGDGNILAGSNGQAGIGGGNNQSSGNVIINSGNVVAQSMSYSAGIGGGSTGSNGSVVINGGNVTAVGGESAAGIGGGCTGNGGNITINGGTVTAAGGANAAGIGGGWYGYMGNVVINGGSVKAIGGKNAPSIGAGGGVKSEPILNSDGETLYLAKFNSSVVSSVKDIYTNGKSNNISSYHSNDPYFYFYLPAETHIFSADSDVSPTGFWKAEYKSSFTCTQINPVEFINGASVRADDVISGLSCGLSDLKDYTNLLPGFSLNFSQSKIGTGTQVDLVYENNIIFSYQTLVYGDLNNDSFYDGEDSFIALLILWEMLDSSNTDSLIIEAADADRNGAVEKADVEILQKAGLVLQSVPQNSDGTINTDSTQWNEYVVLIDQTAENTTDFNFDWLLSLIKNIIEKILHYMYNII